MLMSSPASRRRRLCIALPAIVLAGTASLAAHARPTVLSEAERVQYFGGYEVALNLDLFGETSRPIVRTRDARQVTVSGTHADTPWRLEFTVTRFQNSDQLLVSSRLSSGKEVLAAPVRTIVAGQRVVVRADDAMNVAFVVKTA